MSETPTIIIDTREQKPFTFAKSRFGIVSRKLESGDYSILGHEHLFAIERKGSVSEIAQNLVDRDGRFERELQRLESFRHSHVLMAFHLEDLLDYPFVADVPAYLRKRIRVRGPFLLKKMVKFMSAYPNTRWHFAGNRAEQFALCLIKDYLENVENDPAD